MTKTNGRRTLDQFDPVETLAAVCMVPLAVGPSPLVGTGNTTGPYSNRVWVLRRQTPEFGANATSTLPFLGDFLDRMAELVEQMGDLRLDLAHSF